jgi:glyoxylase-like metal-dependent hydrolase (beta-lactamase superfamily II)
MKRFACVLVVSLWASLLTFAELDVFIEINRLSDRVYVCNVDNHYYIPVIVSEAGLIVIDSTNYPTLALKVKTKIVEELGINNFRYLINTHHHHDHTCGNQVFDEATIIGHDSVPGEMRKFEENFQKFVDYRKNYYKKRDDLRTLTLLDELENHFHSTPPDKTFADVLRLELKDVSLILYHVGKDGEKTSLYNHSRSDIFVYFPEEKVLCTGDVYYKKEWLQSFPKGQDLEKFNGFFKYCLDNDYEVRTVVFGHEPVLQIDPVKPKKQFLLDISLGAEYAYAVFSLRDQIALDNHSHKKSYIK